jgi:hypothetical protein
MGSEFLVYLRLGFEHIADPRGYDHILFIVALTAMYMPRDWRRLVALVTAFTVGHSITLALATLGFIRLPTALIEFLIPVTILMTAVSNAIDLRRVGGWHPRGGLLLHGDPHRRGQSQRPGDAKEEPGEIETRTGPWHGQGVRYTFALGFGLIHGMGFSNFLRAVLGGEASIVWPLFAFNLGLEIGQVLIVALVLAGTALATSQLCVPQRWWAAALSSTAGVTAMYLVWERLPLR